MKRPERMHQVTIKHLEQLCRPRCDRVVVGKWVEDSPGESYNMYWLIISYNIYIFLYILFAIYHINTIDPSSEKKAWTMQQKKNGFLMYIISPLTKHTLTERCCATPKLFLLGPCKLIAEPSPESLARSTKDFLGPNPWGWSCGACEACGGWWLVGLQPV